MRALDLACRAFGLSGHPLLLALDDVRWRASSSRPSWCMRFSFCTELGGVVALVGNAAAAIELEDPARDVVEEVAVMGDDQDGARIVCADAARARRPSRRRDGWSARRAAAGRARESSSWQSATRRFSPPESLSTTSPSPGGQRSASIACSTCASRSQRFCASISSWSCRHLVGGLVGVVHQRVVVAVEDRLLAATPSMTFRDVRAAGRAAAPAGDSRRGRPRRPRPRR